MSGFFDFCCGGSDSRSNQRGSADNKAFNEYASGQAADDGSPMLVDEDSRAAPQNAFEEDLSLLEETIMENNAMRSRYERILAEEEANILRRQADEERARMEQLAQEEALVREREVAIANQKRELEWEERQFEATELSAALPEIRGHEAHLPSPIGGEGLLEQLTLESDDESKIGEQGGQQLAASGFLQAGVASFYRKEYTLAKRQLKLCIRAATVEQDEVLQARSCGNLANVYEALGRSAKALLLYRYSIELLRKNGDTTRERFVISNALFSFVRLKQYREAIEMAGRQIEILRAQEHSSPADLEISQSLEDTRHVVEVLESAIKHGHEVVLDSDPGNRVLFAVQDANQSVYSN